MIFDNLLDHSACGSVVSNGSIVCLCPAARCFDLRDNFVRRRLTRILLAISPDAGVVNRDDCTLLRQQESHFFTNAPAGAGDDGGFSLKMHFNTHNLCVV